MFSFPEFFGTPLHVEYPVIPLNSHLKTNLSSQQSVEVEVVVSVPTFESHGFSRWVCLSFFTPPSRDTLPKQSLYLLNRGGSYFHALQIKICIYSLHPLTLTLLSKSSDNPPALFSNMFLYLLQQNCVSCSFIFSTNIH